MAGIEHEVMSNNWQKLLKGIQNAPSWSDYKCWSSNL